MIKRIWIATALMIAGCTYTATAQQNVQMQNEAAFLSDVKSYEHIHNKAESAKKLEEIKENISYGIDDAKMNIATAQERGDDAEAERFRKLNQKRAEIYNKLVTATRKEQVKQEEIISLLKMYSETLK